MWLLNWHDYMVNKLSTTRQEKQWWLTLCTSSIAELLAFLRFVERPEPTSTSYSWCVICDQNIKMIRHGYKNIYTPAPLQFSLLLGFWISMYKLLTSGYFRASLKGSMKAIMKQVQNKYLSFFPHYTCYWWWQNCR